LIAELTYHAKAQSWSRDRSLAISRITRLCSGVLIFAGLFYRK
jgi:hypothetical protein